jgi:hypothetical protein
MMGDHKGHVRPGDNRDYHHFRLPAGQKRQ